MAETFVARMQEHLSRELRLPCLPLNSVSHQTNIGSERFAYLMSGPQITVALPVYNGQEHLTQAIDSVLKQTFVDFELLILDNCSVDQTLKIAQSFHDPRIRIVSNEKNIGMIGNWNKAVELALGEYIKILSHDDLLEPTCLAEQFRGFQKLTEKNIGIVTGKRQIINESGKVIMPGLGLFGPTRLISGTAVARKVIRAGRNIVGEPSVVLLRTSLLKSMGGFEEPQYTPDIKMWLKILRNSDLMFINVNLAQYRLSSTSTSNTISSSQGAQFVELIRGLEGHSRNVFKRANCLIGIIRAHLNAKLRRAISSLAAKKI